jgi:dipeptidyl aminopeptidase/acylaminoacyl peptidase
VAIAGGQADIHVVPAGGGAPYRATNHPLDELAPSWTRDGQYLYFASRRSGEWQVWWVSLENGAEEQITHRGGYAAQESHDGTWLYFTRSDERGLWRQNRADGTEILVTTDLAVHDWGNWALGPTSLVHVARTSDGPAFVACDLDGGRERRIAWADSLVGHGLSLSSNGAWLAYSRADRAECDIMAMENLGSRRPVP